MDEENEKRYISEEDSNPQYHKSESVLGSGQTQSFGCPECGSHNTAQGVYFDECRSCGWNQGY